jgi:hypothetical protein
LEYYFHLKLDLFGHPFIPFAYLSSRPAVIVVIYEVVLIPKLHRSPPQ